MLKKFIISLLCAVFVSTCISCGYKGNSSKICNDASVKQKEEKIVLTYWVPMDQELSDYMESYSEMQIYKEIENKTNVKVKFIHPTIGLERESYKLMVESNNMADIIGDTTIHEDLYGEINKEMFVELQDFIERLAPNYNKVINKNKRIKNSVKNEHGEIYKFYCIDNELSKPSYGPVIRGDILEGLDIAEPKTLDDLENVMYHIKETGKFKYPLEVTKKLMDSTDVFTSAFDLGQGWFLNNNKEVTHCLLEPNFKQYLNLMRKWYEKGYINKEFNSKSYNSVLQDLVNGETAMAIVNYKEIPCINCKLKSKNETANVKAIVYPTLNKNSSIRYKKAYGYNEGYGVAISNKSKNVIKAIEVLDFGYSDEGSSIYNYGTKEKSFCMKKQCQKNGKNKEKIYGTNLYKIKNAPFLREPFYKDISNFEQSEALSKWDLGTEELNMQGIVRVKKEGIEYEKYEKVTQNYINNNLHCFIEGTMKIEEYEKFSNELKRIGFGAMKDLNEKAYARYLNIPN